MDPFQNAETLVPGRSLDYGKSFQDADFQYLVGDHGGLTVIVKSTGASFTIRCAPTKDPIIDPNGMSMKLAKVSGLPVILLRPES